MDITSWKSLLIVLVFCIGYVAIILEYYIKVNKSAVALFIAVLCWAIYLGCSTLPVGDNVNILGHHVSEISQIIFFLMGAMALVELIDSHRGFKMITDRIKTKSTRKMLWVIALVTFFLSAILDNLTTTILMVSLLRKLIPHRARAVFALLHRRDCSQCRGRLDTDWRCHDNDALDQWAAVQHRRHEIPLFAIDHFSADPS